VADIILGIDPGLLNTGWGIIKKEGSKLSYIASGTIATQSNEEMSQRLFRISSELEKIIESYRPLDCAIEETFVNKNPMLSLKLGYAKGVAILAAGKQGLNIFEYAPRLVKKALVGNGGAQKDQIFYMIKQLLPLARVTNDHESDALAISICHANLKNSYIK
jgi:crossover junction endodeoxyribonuclease RuvC